ncbi:MAG: hypothetical protein CVU05_03945 [Bacteroidetes bacterium HGW-Bacteroidetes-21]|jgi:signal transduction histidine kinase|nr:MAG: hypothetical protein CVU05_03945 [Bacteroidetes bacterium HGW-Bacteroidetes-21]
MKLHTKTTLLFILVTLSLFLAGGFIFYFQLKSTVDEEVTEDLYLAKENVLRMIKDNGDLSEKQFLFRGNFSVDKEINGSSLIHDTLLFDENENEYLLYRELVFPVRIDNSDSTIKISLPLFESDDLIESIGFSILIISILLVITLFIISGFISFKLWKPFYKTLQAIEQYQVRNQTLLMLPKVKTQEFAKLNEVISAMSIKIEENFQQLRSFTENASHEIQTPITAIRIETEQLMQNTQLSENELKFIHRIHNSAIRLGKMNESLLLLAKIGNDQFPQTETSFSTILEDKLESYQDRILLKNLQLTKEINGHVVVHSSTELVGILISNLLSNAIRHNSPGGLIQMELTANQFIIQNSGKPLPFEKEKLFQRFVRDIETTNSTGLGLALVKDIAEKNRWSIQYEYIDNRHIFTLNFGSEKQNNLS